MQPGTLYETAIIVDRFERACIAATEVTTANRVACILAWRGMGTLAPRFSRAASMPDANLAEMLAAREIIQRLMQLVEGEHPIDDRA